MILISILSISNDTKKIHPKLAYLLIIRVMRPQRDKNSQKSWKVFGKFYRHPYKEGENNFIKKSTISSFYTNDSQSSIFALFFKYLAHYAIIRDL